MCSYFSHSGFFFHCLTVCFNTQKFFFQYCFMLRQELIQPRIELNTVFCVSEDSGEVLIFLGNRMHPGPTWGLVYIRQTYYQCATSQSTVPLVSLLSYFLFDTGHM